MKALLSIGSLHRAAGGPSIMLAGLSRALVRQGIDVDIVCQAAAGQGGQVDLDPQVKLHEFSSGWPRQYAPSCAARACLKGQARDADIIHNFGMWLAINRYSGLAAASAGKPLVYSPQGMLEAEALGRSSWKKRAAFAIWERRNLRLAVCLHATGEKEYASIRQAGISDKPVAIVPNGVDLPDEHEIAGRDELERQWPMLRDRPYLLFLGRIHPFKGPDTMFTAWHKASNLVKDCLLVFAGPDFEGYSNRIKTMAEQEGESSSLLFTGEVDGRLKQGLLAHALALVLPSKSENFGNVVIEALACRTPVIANRNAPWEALVKNDCGWWIEPSEVALGQALEEVVIKSQVQRAEMGARGRELARSCFSWEKIGRDMASVYRWIINRGAVPDCVRFKTLPDEFIK